MYTLHRGGLMGQILRLILAGSLLLSANAAAMGQESTRIFLPSVEQSWFQRYIHGIVTLSGAPLQGVDVFFNGGPMLTSHTETTDAAGFYNVRAISLDPESQTASGVVTYLAYRTTVQPAWIDVHVGDFLLNQLVEMPTVAVDPILLVRPEEGSVIRCNATTEFVWELPAVVISEKPQVEVELGTVYSHWSRYYGAPWVHADVTGAKSLALYVPCGSGAEDLKAGESYTWRITATSPSGVFRATADRPIVLAGP